MPLDYFLAREKALLGARYEALYQAQSPQPARGVTVNRLRCMPEWFLRHAGLALEPSPFCEQGFLVRQEEFAPGRHPYHHAGAFYVQEPSASAPAPLLGVRPGERVLDLCAAPGGKSSQLAAALGGEGLLVCNEYDVGRAQILKANLERMGVSNAVVLNETPDRIADALPGFFHRVLVDAPCSGEGMFRKEPQAVQQHGPGLVAQCAALGAGILDAAAACLAPGGVLVYSTCTFSPEEDEGQIGAFLARHPAFALLDPTCDFGSPGESNRCGAHPFDPGLVRRIWPCQGGEGHFMAKLQKAGPEDLSGPARDAGRFKPEKPAKPCKEWLAFAAEYFPGLAQRPVRLYGDTVLLPPPQELPKNALRTLRGGVLAGSLQKGRFVPAHHLFTAFGSECSAKLELTLDDPRTAAYLRGEEIGAEGLLPGWCCVRVDGLPLGAGKASGGRLKNHYPKALRNLK